MRPILVTKSFLDGDSEDELEAVTLEAYEDGWVCIRCREEA